MIDWNALFHDLFSNWFTVFLWSSRLRHPAEFLPFLTFSLCICCMFLMGLIYLLDWWNWSTQDLLPLATRDIMYIFFISLFDLCIWDIDTATSIPSHSHSLLYASYVLLIGLLLVFDRWNYESYINSFPVQLFSDLDDWAIFRSFIRFFWLRTFREVSIPFLSPFLYEWHIYIFVIGLFDFDDRQIWDCHIDSFFSSLSMWFTYL